MKKIKQKQKNKKDELQYKTLKLTFLLTALNILNVLFTLISNILDKIFK